MIVKPAQRMDNVGFSSIRRAYQRAMELRAQGKSIIDLTLGRPSFESPMEAVVGAQDAMARGEFHYTPNSGIPELRQALAAKLLRQNNIQASPQNEILVTLGATEGVYLTMAGFLDPGDEVIVPSPTYLSYIHCLGLVGAKGVFVPMIPAEGGFRPNLQAIADAVSPKTKMLIVNSPQNPTGTLWSREELTEVLALAQKHNLLVMSDEVYEDVAFDHAEVVSLAALPGGRERTLTIYSLSKTYSMTGWRVGYLVGPEDLMSIAMRIHQHIAVCAPSISQWAALKVLAESEYFVKECAAEFARRRDILIEGYRSMAMPCPLPQGTFYSFPSVTHLGMTSEQAFVYMLEECGVAVVPGHAFGPGGEGHVRISFASSADEITEAIERLRSKLSR